VVGNRTNKVIGQDGQISYELTKEISRFEAGIKLINLGMAKYLTFARGRLS
tara:strand:+ start:756 stop:908 length:153 start_codon:yes stop_codon:yes gene_type:complete